MSLSKYAVTKEKSARIDLGLAVSGALLPPGKRRTLDELAAFAGCTKNAIASIEAAALKKLRHPAKLKVLAATLEDLRQP